MGMDINADGGLSQDYIDRLKRDLVTAKADFDNYGKAASKANKEHGLAVQHHADLSTYCNQLTTTYLKIGDLYDYLTTLVTHAANVGTNVSVSFESLKIVFHHLKCLCEKVEEMRNMNKALIKALEDTGSEVLNVDGATLMQCLRDIDTETEAALTNVGEAMMAVIALYRCVLDLHHFIGANGETEMTGLVRELEQLRRVLCCDYRAGINDMENPACPTEDQQDGSADLAQCCGEPAEVEACECELEKPAVCDGGFQSDFFCDYIIEAKEKADKLVKYKKCVHQYFEKKKSAALAKHDSIKKALDAALKAKALCN